MGILVPDNRKTNEDETKLLEGKHEATQNFHILYRLSLETFIEKEAAKNEVTQDTVWDAMHTSPTTNKFLDQLPHLIAQTYLSQKRRSEEVEQEERRQHSLKNFYDKRDTRRCKIGL